MISYTLRSLLQFLPVLYIVSVVVFLLVYLLGDPTLLLIPDDATEEERLALYEALGLDQPWYVQYWRYTVNILSGDFGVSYRYGTSALPVVLERIPATLQLTGGALLVALVIGFPAGVVAAARRNSPLDIAVTSATVLGKALPNFWVGIMLILVFSVGLGWLPVSGKGGVEHLVLPALTLGTGFAAEIAKIVRSNLSEALGQDYIRTARSRGVPGWIVLAKHALRNALLGVTTVTSLHVIGLLGGALVTESVFAWPGIGLLLVQAIGLKDMAVIQITVFLIAVLALLINLATDLLYRAIDPRVRIAKG